MECLLSLDISCGVVNGKRGLVFIPSLKCSFTLKRNISFPLLPFYVVITRFSFDDVNLHNNV